MYYSSGEEAILVVIGSSRNSSVCQRVEEFRLSAVWYDVRGIVTMSYVILYIMTRWLSMRL